MKLAVVFNANKFSGRLTRLFTGCFAYHVAWVDEQAGLMYDMHLIRRRRLWPRYEGSQVVLFDIPEVTREHLEDQLTRDGSTYGWIDYILFSLRPIYHLFGQSTRNANGVICSEMVNDDMRACGREAFGAAGDPPPSPCDLYRWLRTKGIA